MIEARQAWCVTCANAVSCNASGCLRCQVERGPIMTDDNDPITATLHEGDATWHDGPGWYYIEDEYPEGSCGAFATREQAIEHARLCGLVAS